MSDQRIQKVIDLFPKVADLEDSFHGQIYNLEWDSTYHLEISFHLVRTNKMVRELAGMRPTQGGR